LLQGTAVLYHVDTLYTRGYTAGAVMERSADGYQISK
jgi:hypothetical protein